MAQYNIPYNNWEDGDVAYAEQVLANFNAILSAINNGLGADNLAADSVTDVKIGTRTINDATAATDTAQLTAHLSGLANRIKAITGEDNWKTVPVKSLKTMNTAVVTAVEDSAAAVNTANTADGKADTAISTANTADGKADSAVNTANTALGQDTVEPYTGALGAMKIATEVQTDYETQKPLILQAVEDAEDAVASVAGKADVSYVDSVAASFVLGTVPDGTITDAKLSNTAGQIKPRVAAIETSVGAANGIATLDATGNVPLSELGNVPTPVLSADNITLDNANFTATDVDGGMTELFNNLGSTITEITATFLSAGWTGSAAPYTQSVTVAGVTVAGIRPTVYELVGNDLEEAALISIGASKIYGYFVTANDTVTAYATEVPDVDIPVVFQVVS